MSRWYRKTKRDTNHGEIVSALEAIGASVVDLAACGGGVPDLLCGYRGKNVLLEVKRPGVAGKKRGARQAAVNERQAEFRAAWRGQTAVVETTQAAIDAVTQ